MFPLIIATGPLTSDALSADIAALVGGDHLYFYDAISPIVLAETIDTTRCSARRAGGAACAAADSTASDVRAAASAPPRPAPPAASTTAKATT